MHGDMLDSSPMNLIADLCGTDSLLAVDQLGVSLVCFPTTNIYHALRVYVNYADKA